MKYHDAIPHIGAGPLIKRSWNCSSSSATTIEIAALQSNTQCSSNRPAAEFRCNCTHSCLLLNCTEDDPHWNGRLDTITRRPIEDLDAMWLQWTVIYSHRAHRLANTYNAIRFCDCCSPPAAPPIPGMNYWHTSPFIISKYRLLQAIKGYAPSSFASFTGIDTTRSSKCLRK